MADGTEYHVTNLMEELVDVRLNGDMETAGICTCPKCRADVFALALNHLPPHYVVTNKGNVFSHLSSSTLQSQAEILVAITEAIQLVGSNPRHDEE